MRFVSEIKISRYYKHSRESQVDIIVGLGFFVEVLLNEVSEVTGEYYLQPLQQGFVS